MKKYLFLFIAMLMSVSTLALVGCSSDDDDEQGGSGNNNGKECHLEGICEMVSDNSFKVTMTKPFTGLTTTKQFDNVEAMDMNATFSQVEKDLIKLYEQGRIESK